MGQKVKFDLSNVETFQRASEGRHTVKIASAELKQSSGGNDMIVISFEVTKGEDKGARVYENFPLVDTALWKLKTLLQSIGMKADGKVQLDLDKLLGKICDINVQHEEYDGKIRARVESIMKLAAVTEDVDDDDDDDDLPFGDDEDEKPAKKSKATQKKSEPEEDEDDDDDWDDDEEEEEEKSAPKKAAKTKAAPKKETKKAAKKVAKKAEPEDDDDWDDDDDDDWDEE